MKAFLINPTEKAITEVEYDGTLESIKDYIQAPLFDVIRINEAGDVLFVDDEGLYKQGDLFRFENCENPIAGIALVLGTNYEGESIEPMLESIETLEDKVTFITLEQAIEMADDCDAVAANEQEKHPGHFFYVPIGPILKDRLKEES